MSERSAFAALIAALTFAPAAGAEDARSASQTELDAELLEFLGSIDLAGEEWLEYHSEAEPTARGGKPPAKPGVEEK